MIYYKGFNSKLQCQPDKDKEPFQFEVGKTYEEDSAELCKKGFHACENPLDVLGYYSPADSRYCMVELEDVQADEGQDDSKVCGKKIRIGAEIGLKGLIEAGAKFVLKKVDFQSAQASSTGDGGVSSSTGYGGVSSSTGNDGVASSTGWRGVASSTGDGGVASSTGNESVAVSLGFDGKAKAALGCWIVLAEWQQDRAGEWHRIEVRSAQVDGEDIKADTFYRLKDGQFVETE